jgi:hypothetical protein
VTWGRGRRAHGTRFWPATNQELPQLTLHRERRLEGQALAGTIADAFEYLVQRDEFFPGLPSARAGA